MTPDPDFARELAKQLPVREIYQDAAAPAVRQTGQLAEDLLKVVELALAPVQFVAALQDRFRHFLDSSIRRVPESRRIAPAPQILGPVLEGVRYEPEGTPIDEMFSNLLSKSMDSEEVNQAHPAYPLIIRQLSSDEAKTLSTLNKGTFDYVYTRDYDRKTALFHGPHKIEIDAFPRDELRFPGNVDFYFEHLNKLGLAGIFQQGNQEPVFGEVDGRREQTGTRGRCKYMLTTFGQEFMKACTPSLL